MGYIRDKLINMQDDVRVTRRDLHRIPEGGFEETKTQAYLKHQLQAMGVAYEEVVGTGLVACLPGKDRTRATAYRSDIDGLGMEEVNDHGFVSGHPGMMHACGHDGHMTMALGILKYLVEEDITPACDLVVIFQPAEEGPGGAEPILEQGILERYHVTDIFGYHLFPEVQAHRYASRSGAMMAHTGEFDIDISTPGAHGAMPHLGVDAGVLAAELLMKIQTIVSRTVDPIDPAVMTVGRMVIGQRRNVIADHARLEGTMRAFSDGAFYTMRDMLYKYSEQMADEKVQVKVGFRDMYREVNNDPGLLGIFREAVGEDLYEETPLQMIAEDFSFYQRRIPGLFVFLGIHDAAAGHVHPLHSAHFDFDESVLLDGIEGYLRYLEARGLIDGQ